jgi:hypothetical protein
MVPRSNESAALALMQVNGIAGKFQPDGQFSAPCARLRRVPPGPGAPGWRSTERRGGTHAGDKLPFANGKNRMITFAWLGVNRLEAQCRVT